MGSSKKSKKRKRSSQPIAPQEEETFAVELILKARVAEGALDKTQDDHWEYYVKWAGYDSDANTWEPARNFTQCERLVASFWENVGWDNVDYPEGSEVKPSDEWIEMEKKRFWQNLTPKERQTFQTREAEQRAQTQQRKAVEAAYGAYPVLSTGSSPEPEKRSKSKKKKTKKPRIVKEESDDSDVPLMKQGRSKLGTIPVKRKERSSDDEPLEQRTKRKAKARKFNTLVEPLAGSPGPSSQLELAKLQSPTLPVEQLGVDKGKQKAIEETRSGSPSSLFSADSSDEVVVPSAQSASQHENRSVPESKSSTSFPSVVARPGSFKPSPTVPPKASSHIYLIHPEPPPVPTSMAGIPTKQRLAAGASTLFNPKDAKAMVSVPARTNTNTTSSSNLSNLKFKKSSALTVVVPNDSAVESPKIRSPGLTLNALNAPATQEQSPVHMFTDSFQTDSPIGMEPPSNILSASPKASQHPNAHEADEFLASMAPSLPGFAGPLEPASEPTFEPKPPPGLTAPRKASSLPKIQKKWKWEGQLFILKGDDKEELVGSVVCTNVTTPKPRGMRIPLTFDAMHQLNFISFYELSDVPFFLEACKTPDQFATLAGQDNESQLQIRTITSYMAKHEQVVLVPVWYENNVVGYLLIFPPAFKGLVQQLQVPTETTTQAAESLIVSLHGWIISPTMQHQEPRLPLSDIVPAKTSLAPVFGKTRTQTGPPGSIFDHSSILRTNIQFALRILAFPPDLFDWLMASFRLYAVYHEYERGDDKSEPTELRMLKVILGSCQAREWKHQGSNSKKEYRLRVVFVHVGSIHNFSRSPLTQKRNSLDIRFYSYGTDGNIPRSMWGFREIYPIGGIVTFYPSAFMEDYTGSIRLIQKIHEHPLWMAFISPACLGYLINVICPKGQDPSVTYERQVEGREFTYHRLLQLIADGEIALISIPSYSASNERMITWVRNYCCTLDPLSALSVGNAAFNSVCANVPHVDWIEMIQKNVDHDIVATQQHPAVLYEYRRFIVVKGMKDHTVTPTSVEVTAPHQFDFQDDYFKQKS